MKWPASISAFIFYGGWSAWLNLDAGNSAWLLSGISHGLYAFIFTLIFFYLTCWIFHRVSHLHHARYITFFAMSTVIVFVPVAIQWFAGNMRIGLTLLPGIIIGHIYLLLLLRFELPATGSRKVGMFLHRKKKIKL